MRYALLKKGLGVQRFLRWLKIFTSPRLLVHLSLERSRFRNDGRICVAVSETLRSIVADTFMKPNDGIHVIPPGIKDITGAVAISERLAARAVLGLPLDGTCLLLVGNDLRKKGLACLIQSLAQLTHLSTYVAVVGHAGQQASWERMARDLGVGSRLHFLGVREDVSAAYKASSFLVHPTLEDSYAMVVLEAMAHGIPVIVSQAAYCGIAAELTDGVNAILLEDPRDSSALALMVNRLEDSPELRSQLSHGGIEFATGRTWRNVAQRYEAVYALVEGVAG